MKKVTTLTDQPASETQTKTCSVCLCAKSTSEFYSKGNGRLMHCCKSCDSARKKKYYQENKAAIQQQQAVYTQTRFRPRRALVDSLKEGRPCTDCGQSFPIVCMDFDHVIKPKRFSIGRWPNRLKFSEEDLHSEIAKCELVCANCHCIRTYGSETGDEQDFSTPSED